MRRVLNWIRSWFRAASVVRQLSGNQLRLESLKNESAKATERLERRAGELDAAIESVLKEVDDAKRVNRRYEFALEEIREQNKVLEKTIQTLVASHELLIARYDAETSIAVRTRVATSTRE